MHQCALMTPAPSGSSWPTASAPVSPTVRGSPVKIPSVRDLAIEAGTNPNTVQRALAALDDEGLTVPKRTAGRYVATDDTALHALRQEDARAAVDAFIRACRALGVDVDGAHGLVDERWNADL